MSAKSTPGPWRVTDMKHTVGRGVWAGSGPNEYRVCGVGLSHVQGQMEANARLIAAAPDLLAELQNIANANPLNWDAPCNDFATFYAWAQSRARAAIAKAVTP